MFYRWHSTAWRCRELTITISYDDFGSDSVLFEQLQSMRSLSRAKREEVSSLCAEECHRRRRKLFLRRINFAEFFSHFSCRCRRHLRLQGPHPGVRSLPRLRDAIHKSQADQWLPIRRHEHLQHRRVVLNHCTCGHGDSIATGRFVCLRSAGCYLLLLSQHAADLCAKGEAEAEAFPRTVICLNWKMLSHRWRRRIRENRHGSGWGRVVSGLLSSLAPASVFNLIPKPVYFPLCASDMGSNKFLALSSLRPGLAPAPSHTLTANFIVLNRFI